MHVQVVYAPIGVLTVVCDATLTPSRGYVIPNLGTHGGLHSGPCIGNILQHGLHAAMALMPAPYPEFDQTHTVAPPGCWGNPSAVSAHSGQGFALGGPRNGRARQKNGRGENSENSENRQAT